MTMTSPLTPPPWHAGPADAFPLGRMLILFALLGAALASPWLSGAVTVPWDAKAHFHPQLVFLAQSLHRGEAPFWTPFVFAGSPQIADPQALLTSPPHLFIAALNPDPGLRAADAALFLMLAAGGAALIGLFRDRNWHPAGALLAAMVFAFGASAAWRIQHVGQILSYAWWPIAWLCLDRALRRGSWTYGLLAGLAAGVMALGRDQVAYLALWHLAAVALTHLLRPDVESRASRLRRAVGPLCLGGMAAIALVAVPMLLTLLLHGESNRVAIDLAGAERGSLHPAHLLTAAVPKLFGTAGPLVEHWGPPSPTWGPVDLFLARNMGHVYLGALPLGLLIGVGLGAGRFGHRAIRLTALAAGAALLYALGRYTPVFGWLFAAMPGVAFFRRPADATFLLGGLGAVLAGYALHRLLTDADLPLRRVLAVAAGGLAAMLIAAGGVALAKDRLDYAMWPLAQAALTGTLALIVIALLRRWRERTVPLLLLAGLPLAADLAWNNGPNESTALPPSMYDALDPRSADPLIAALKARVGMEGARRDRVELAGLGFHWPNASLVHRLDNTLGYNPVRLRWYSEATGAGDHVALPDQRRFSPLMPSYRSPLANLLGLRWIATGAPIETIDPALKPGDLLAQGRIGEAYLYENPRALTRVRRVERWRTADPEALIATGQWPEGYDPARETLLPPDAVLPSAERQPADTPDATPGYARIRTYANNEVVVETAGPRRAVLVLADVWHPWWQAEIDGRPVDLMRADGLFRAVAVPAGRREVRFVFRPFAGAWAEFRRRLTTR